MKLADSLSRDTFTRTRAHARESCKGSSPSSAKRLSNGWLSATLSGN
jgi:hypothetical protein